MPLRVDGRDGRLRRLAGDLFACTAFALRPVSRRAPIRHLSRPAIRRRPQDANNFQQYIGRRRKRRDKKDEYTYFNW